MTSAAAPATSGDDSLVPPVNSIGEPAVPAKFVQSVNRVSLGLQSAQFESPGATMSTVRPAPENPLEEMLEMLLSTICPFAPGTLTPPSVTCSKARKVVVAPTLRTFGSVAGDPIVLVMPPSPLDATTVTPAATAASSAIRVTSAARSGKLLLPKDSLMTLAPCITA